MWKTGRIRTSEAFLANLHDLQLRDLDPFLGCVSLNLQSGCGWGTGSPVGGTTTPEKFLCLPGEGARARCLYTQSPSPSFILTALATFGKHSEAFFFIISWERVHKGSENTLMPY